MRKIEKRAVICMALAILLAAGMSVFLIRYFAEGGKWASSAFNRHLYDSNGVLISGTVLDRDGDVLSSVENGHRTYYENETVRKATLHAVGDLYGKIGTGVLNAFADKLTGFDLVNGAFGAERGSNLYLTLDARYNYEAYRALGGRAGTVAVYNYKTGEILCMVSAPSYDPLNVPKNLEENDRYKGAYLNRFLSSAFVPGSVFKTVTLTAALENLPDAETRTWNCTGSVQIGDETITCSGVHGEQTLKEAFAHSCNAAFAQIAEELGADTLRRYTEKAGLTSTLFRGRPAHRQGHVQLGRHHRRAAGLGRCGPIPRSGEPLCLPVVDGGHCQRRQGGGTVSDPENGVLTGDPVFAPHYSAHRTADRQQNGGHRGGLYGQ